MEQRPRVPPGFGGRPGAPGGGDNSGLSAPPHGAPLAPANLGGYGAPGAPPLGLRSMMNDAPRACPLALLCTPRRFPPAR
jgi:hypothetical protein